MPEDKIRSIIRSEFPKAIVKQIYNNFSTFTSSLSATQPTQTKILPTNDTLVKMAKEAAKNAEIERAKTDKPRKRTITRTTSRPTHSIGAISTKATDSKRNASCLKTTMVYSMTAMTTTIATMIVAVTTKLPSVILQFCSKNIAIKS